MGNNWAIVVGINSYERLRAGKQLKYAVRDAESVGHFLEEKEEFKVLLCTDNSKPFGRFQTCPRRHNLWDLLKNGIRQAERADNFWFFFSGHGAVGPGRKDYLLTCDFIPSDIRDSAISVDFVIDCLMDCSPKNIMLVLDMCRDGVADGSKSINEVGTQTLEKAKHQGITTIFSCGRGEESYEIPEIQQSAFTYALLEGLKNCVTPRELEKYLGQRVPRINQEYGKPYQNPLIIPEPGYKYDDPLFFNQTQLIRISQFQERSHQSDTFSRSIQDLENPLLREDATKPLQQKFTTPSIPNTQIFYFDVIIVNASGQEIKRQRQRSQHLIQTLGKVQLEMVVIPSGSFRMGSLERRPSSNEIPVHSVTIRPFLMSKYPITKAQWKEVAKLEQVHYPLKLQPSPRGSSKHPATEVSWYDAFEFCDRLSQATGHSYRLPSEAEWEFACRAGTTTPFHFGETITPDLANYDGRFTYHSEPKGVNREKALDVGSLPFANTFGLVDMHGNVWEWCMDHWHENYNQAPTTATAWLDECKNLSRVMRGGSWRSEASRCCSTYRQIGDVNHRSNDIGFRIVRDL